MPYYAKVVGVNITKLVAYNPKRITLNIINLGNYACYISEDPMYVRENGFPLPPLTSITLTIEDGDYAFGELYCVCEGTCEIRISEGVVKP